MSIKGRVGIRSVLTVLCAALSLAACTGQTKPNDTAPKAVVPMTVDWREVTLPVPPGPPGRLALRDAVDCGGRWYVVGAVIGVDGASRPAAWDSADGDSWHVLTFEALPTSYYGPRNIIYTVACRADPGGAVQVAMIGAKSGGAHGNPRTSNWYLRPDGVMAEVSSAWEVFGGPDAVKVGRLAAGPAGFLIAGIRVSGAAVWLSADGKDFRLIERAPQLATDEGFESAASDAIEADGQWVVVGGATAVGRPDRDPAVWLSSDGTAWRRVVLPGDDTYEELQRVVHLGGDAIAVGLRGQTFGAWRGRGEAWQVAGRFGSTAAGAVADARSLTVVNGRLLAAVNDGAGYGLWSSADGGRSWGAVALPAAQAAGSERSVSVAGRGKSVLLIGDDAKHGRVWVAAL